jgi:DNA-binding transcriptional regulator LsrR (DeoR family)
MTRVARLYYERGLPQREIAEQLDLSQSTVSRLLKRAETERLVRITVSVSSGTYPELEEALEQRYRLKEVIVVDSARDEDQLQRNLGAAAAFYLESSLKPGEVIGISSWSGTLLAMVDSMHPASRTLDVRVVQILGGVGNPAAEVHAAHITGRLASLLRGEAVYLPAPGVAGSEQARDVLLQDPFVREAAGLFDHVTLALVGIGTVEPSRLLASSGNVFSSDEIASLRQRGAVGDICLRFFNSVGEPIMTPLESRVIGMKLDQLRRIRRAVGIAGGERKIAAIRGALEGGLVNVLITDREVASRLVDQ